MKVWSYAKKRETERRKEDSLRQSRNVTDVRETEKEKKKGGGLFLDCCVWGRASRIYK